MSYAYDESYGRPAASDVIAAGGDGLLVYSGAAHPDAAYVAAARAAGLKVAWVFESATDRALAGYAAGAADCRTHEALVPPGDLSYVVACDMNNGTLAHRDVTGYLHGWADTTREPVFGQYGSSDAIAQGKTVGGKLQRFWGVVNWCPVGAPDNDPRNIAYWQSVGVHLVQLIGSPVPNTDQNLILDPAWAQPAVPVSSPKDDELLFQLNAPGTPSHGTRVVVCGFGYQQPAGLANYPEDRFIILNLQEWEGYFNTLGAQYALLQKAAAAAPSVDVNALATALGPLVSPPAGPLNVTLTGTAKP